VPFFSIKHIRAPVCADWADDIALASQSGIDGFALNMGQDDWQPARVADAYQAALQSGLDFKLFLSLDMTSLPCASPSDAQALRSLVLKFASHPNQLRYTKLQSDPLPLVSTFAGETCTFGQDTPSNGWRSQFTQSDDLKGKITFVPSFFIDPATFKDFDGVMDGDFNVGIF
jgi:glucan endo-1,3-alpha-glucosidase